MFSETTPRRSCSAEAGCGLCGHAVARKLILNRVPVRFPENSACPAQDPAQGSPLGVRAPLPYSPSLCPPLSLSAETSSLLSAPWLLPPTPTHSRNICPNYTVIIQLLFINLQWLPKAPGRMPKATLDTTLLYSSPLSSCLSHRNCFSPQSAFVMSDLSQLLPQTGPHLANSYTSLRALRKRLSCASTVLDAPSQH